jgi:hypothetical protein
MGGKRKRDRGQGDSDDDYDPSREFYGAVRDLFDEGLDGPHRSRKESKRTFEIMRNAVVNYLAGCRDRGPKATSWISVKFAESEKSQTPVPRPPGWFQLRKRDQQALRQTQTSEEFLPMLDQFMMAAEEKQKPSKAKNQERSIKKTKKVASIKLVVGERPGKSSIEPMSVSEENDAPAPGTARDHRNLPATTPGQAPGRIIRLKRTKSKDPTTEQTHRPQIIMPAAAKASNHEPASAGNMTAHAVHYQECAPTPDDMASDEGRDSGYRSDDTDDSRCDEPASAGTRTLTESTGYGPVSERTRGILSQAGQLNDDLAKIPAVKWQGYSSKLATFCETNDIEEMGFEKRMQRIKRIIYLKEEEAVIASGEWDRLAGVARICVSLREMTGSDDAVDAQQTDRWLERHLKDIQWLKNILGARGEAPTCDV